MPNLSFRFTNSLDRDYLHDDCNVVAVQFCIDRYGQHTKQLRFAEAKTEHDAIRAVEWYLSEAITPEYFAAIEDDLFPGTTLDELQTRGDCLGNCTFLESATLNEGVLTLSCDSC
jgi:hypothetical protein